MKTTTTTIRSAVVLGLLALLTAVLVSSPAAAQSGSTSDSTGMHTPGWVTGGTIPHLELDQFDPASGTLLEVRLTTTGDISTTFTRMSNESGLVGDMEGTTLAVFCAALTAVECSGVTWYQTTAPSADAMVAQATASELFPQMGVSETRVSSSPATANGASSVSLTGADAQAFVGSGDVDVYCHADAFTGTQGPGTAGADWQTTAGCTVSAEYTCANIDIEKTTNGVQADTEGESVQLEIGAAIVWEYIVSTSCNTNLVGVVVTDNMLGDVCIIDTLVPGTPQSCTMTGVAELGLHRMEATATGSPQGYDQLNVTVSDTDPTGYIAAAPTPTPVPPTPTPVPPTPTPVPPTPVPTDPTPVPTTPPLVYENPAIDIELDTNGNDADLPSGPSIAEGGDAVWTYVVRNTGTVPLVNVTVTDGLGNTVCIIGSLGVAQSASCQVEGVVDCQLSRKDSTVTGQSEAGVIVTDADPTHWTPDCSPIIPASAPVPSEPVPADEVAGTTLTATTDEVLAYTGNGNGAAAIALVVSGLGLVLLSGSEALRRRHASLRD